MEAIEKSTASGSDPSENIEKPMSKSQLKKLRKQEKWREMKHERRKADKEKKKQRKAEKRERGEEIGPSRKSLKINTMKNSSCQIKVVLDLSLEEYMGDKDITSLTSQIQHCYSVNRRADNPMQLYACGLGGRTQQRLDSVGDYKGWDVHFKEENYLEAFPKESIVYLSSESSNVLTSLSEDKVYVIGGLVDHNSRKGLCHRLAEENGVSHAQLPISEFLHLKGRKVLAVNHVFSILLRFTETGDWKQAFIAELPTRKGFSPVFDEDSQENPNTAAKKEDESGATAITSCTSKVDCCNAESTADGSEPTQEDAHCQRNKESISNDNKQTANTKELSQERVLIEAKSDSLGNGVDTHGDSKTDKTQSEHSSCTDVVDNMAENS